jgi:BNR/Asp-box repeat.
VLSIGGDENAAPTQPVATTASLQVQGAAAAIPTNVLVNDPSADSRELDQTTQSETTIAAHGPNLVTGYNDSQQALIALTAGADLTGYSYSTNGGASWTDGGTLPNDPGNVNLGDPWLASTSNGDFFYSTLMLSLNGISVGVARSSNGGRTWATPVQILPNLGANGFESADKPALTSGPNPKGGTVLYDAWDDAACNDTTCFNGLPVAHSTDGGRSWKVVYADKVPQDISGCSFTQYIGSQPLVLANGTLDVAAEKISTIDPHCNGAPFEFSEVLFTSTDGGHTFSAGQEIASVTPAFADGALTLGPGELMRTIEFPTIADRGGVLYVAWNDGRRSNHSHIALASSANGGRSWDLSFVTHGTGDEVQPALTADASGLHLLYYGRTGHTLDVYEANSTNASSWSTQRISSQSSPGVPTLPQFDPILAFGYMGDYIANVQDGPHHYFAWGDNRHVVKDLLWPGGRHDPDVFFAKN